MTNLGGGVGTGVMTQARTKKARPSPRSFFVPQYYWIVICFALAFAIFGSVSCNTPSTCLACAALASTASGRRIERLALLKGRPFPHVLPPPADRTARLAEGPLFPERLAARVDCIKELCADRDIAIFDVDFDLVLGDAGKLCLDDVGFRRFDDVQRDGAAGGDAIGIHRRQQYTKGAIERPVQRVVITNQVAHFSLLHGTAAIPSPRTERRWRCRQTFQGGSPMRA